MFDGVFVDLNRRSDEPVVAGSLPWQGFVLALCLAILWLASVILYPDAFGAPVEHF